MEENEEKNPVEQAAELLEQIKEENKKSVELLQRTAQMRAETMLSGKTDAGKPVEKQVSKEDKIKEECNKFLEGTGRTI